MAKRRGVFILPRRSKGEPIPDEELFPGVWEEVKVLRRRGYTVSKENGGYRVGKDFCTTQQMVDKANRERRLSAPFPVLSSTGAPL